MKFILLMLLASVLLACNDGLDIKQNYSFSVKTLPVPKKLKQGEVTALEFTIIKEGEYNKASYSFRYFQPEGKGVLMDNTGKVFPMNRLFPIANDEFTLLYQSTCSDAQTLDFVFMDNFGQEIEYSISFQNDSKKD